MWKGPVTKYKHVYYNSILLYAEIVPLWTGTVRRNASKQNKCRFFHVSTFHAENPIYVILYDRRTWKFSVHWAVLIDTIRRTHKRNFKPPFCAVWRLRSYGKLRGALWWFCHRIFCERLGLFDLSRQRRHLVPRRQKQTSNQRRAKSQKAKTSV